MIKNLLKRIYYSYGIPLIIKKKIDKKFPKNKKIFYRTEAKAWREDFLNLFLSEGQTNLASSDSNSQSKSINQCGLNLNQINHIVSQLKEKGYYVIEDYLNPMISREIVKYASVTPCYPRKKDSEKIDYLPQNLKKPYLSARYDFSPDLKSIFSNIQLQNLIADPFLYSIAEEYLSSTPYLDPVELWWFVPFPERDAAWAEEYHFDYDSIKWLKFFFNFEDVTYENGPHCFIEGTHKDYGISESLRRLGYTRHSDAAIFSEYDKSLEKIFTAKAGSLLIEDTRGLHKGLTPTKGRRLLFSFQLSNYLFIENSDLEKRIYPDFNMSESFSNLYASNPLFFEKYFKS